MMGQSNNLSNELTAIGSLQTSPELEIAFEIVRYTNKCLYLTGKAGSGKTTFLRQIKAEGMKRMAVVAPTGVAAINAGGMTIHSLFQIPLGLHLPGVERTGQEQHRRFSGRKIRLLRSLDLLIIDEISMVRADLLDAVDEVLRRYRNRGQPFGGVQLLMIGDLHQLAPVTKPDEWQILSRHYQTPYFFSSLALQQTDYQSIELKHIYRQADPDFIALLNKVRNNSLDVESRRKLNSRYIPGFQPQKQDAYITLTATNAVAHEINSSNLKRLPGQPRVHTARVQGEFPRGSYPTEVNLEFKAGAQVMFIRNDLGQDRRYFNGKIGQITRLESDGIYVRCPGDSTEIEVEPAEWQNVKYSLNEETKQVEEQILGTFTQIPLKLAWAITIHKSQGLTFERAIIDAQAAFASGQVYVALSRCKSFEGIVLRSPIAETSIKTDMTVRQFSERAERNAPDETYLLQARRDFESQLLSELFSFDLIRLDLNKLLNLYTQHSRSLSPEAVQHLQAIGERGTKDLFNVVQNFSPHLKVYLDRDAVPGENPELQARLQKAAIYFTGKIHGLMQELNGLPATTDNQAVDISIAATLQSLQAGLFTKNACFDSCRDGFSSRSMQRAKVNAELDFAAKSGARSPSSKSGKVPAGVRHPELYRQLLEWREQTAEQGDMAPQAVFPNATLRSLVLELPVEPGRLRHVEGIGKKRLERYGQQLCQIIRKYCDENRAKGNELKPSGSSASESTKPRVSETLQQSFAMFSAGKSIDEIAAARGRAKSTIEGHLASFIASGQLDIHLLMQKEAVEEISRFQQANPEATAALLKVHFGEKYSYGELKMAMSHFQRTIERPP